MIDTKGMLERIVQTFSESESIFKWGDNVIIQGSLEKVLAPDKINKIPDGNYFALVKVGEITEAEDFSSPGLWQPCYNFEIYLFHKTRIGNITALRSKMVDEYVKGWFRYWKSHQEFIIAISSILPQATDVEDSYKEVLCVYIRGTIEHITEKVGMITENGGA